jgi:mono/diheme cytochrome c family protein
MHLGRILLGVVLGVVLLPIALLCWLRFGKPPVAVADKPIYQEKWIAGVPLNARIHRELVATPPILPNEENLVAGAEVYRDHCAECHGYHAKPSKIGTRMYPEAPPLWEKHHTGAVVGVSDDPPAETYWKVANGIRLTGMPAYKAQLTDTEIWQVSLLLANADKPLPPAALQLLRGEVAPAPVPAPPAPAPVP